MIFTGTHGDGLLTAALFKIDIVGGTKLRSTLSSDEHTECLRLYHDTVERVIVGMEGRDLSFDGDGCRCYFVGEGAAISAVEAAHTLQDAIRTLPRFQIRVRIAIGLDNLSAAQASAGFGRVVSHQFNLAGHAEKVCPDDSVAITEEVYLALERRTELAAKFEYHGTTAEDGAAVFVAPRGRPRKSVEAFVPESEDPFPARSALLKYYRSPEFRMLQFRGVRQVERVGAPVDLRDTYIDLMGTPYGGGTTDVFERSTRTRSSIPSRPSTVRLPEPRFRKPQRVREALRSHRSLIVLGDPGSGKTTFLRWLTLVVSGGDRSTRRYLGIENPGPALFIRVGRLWSIFKEHGQGTLNQCIAETFRGLIPDIEVLRLASILDKHNWLFLLDGMDEIPDPRERLEAARLIERLMASIFPQSRFVVTSRILGYPHLNAPHSIALVLEPLDKEQAQDLARHFYRALLSSEETRADRESQDLIAQLSERETLNPFLTNPLLLTLAAIVHTQLGKLPRYRARLYDVACQTLVDAWAQIRRTGDPTSAKETIDYEAEGLRVLPPLALWLHRSKPGGIASRAELLKQIARRLPKSGDNPQRSAERFLNGLTKAGALLVDRGNDQWAFAHQTFQEYLVAKALATSGERAYRKALSEHLYDPRYAEVWRFVSGELSVTQQRYEEAARFVRTIFRDREPLQAEALFKNLLLSVGCLSDAVIVDDELSTAIVDLLVKTVINRPLPLPMNVLFASLRQLRGTPDGTRCAKHLVEILKSSTLAVGKKMADNSGSIPSETDTRSVTNNAIVALEKVADDQIVDDLVELLVVPDHMISWIAVNALRALRDRKQIIAKIEILVRSKDPKIRGHAAYALGELFAKETAPEISQLLADADPSTREQAVWALGGLEATEWAPQIARLLADPDAKVRQNAAFVLGLLKVENVASEIVQLLSDDHAGVRGSAAFAVGELGIRVAIPRLVQLLADPDPYVRMYAVGALGDLKAQEGLHAIVPLLLDGDSEVREFASRTLEQMAEYSPSVVELLDDKEPTLRHSAALALGWMGAQNHVKRLIMLLTDSDRSVRFSSVFALAQMGATEAVPQITVLLDENDPDIRTIAVFALGRLGGPDLVARFGQLLDDKDHPVRAGAASALASLGAKKFAPRIAEMLIDEHPAVRRDAVTALGALGYTDAVSQIQALAASEPDERTRQSMADALWQLSFLIPSRKRRTAKSLPSAKKLSVD